MALFGKDPEIARLERQVALLQQQVNQLQGHVDALHQHLGLPGIGTPVVAGGGLDVAGGGVPLVVGAVEVPDRIRELIRSGKKIQAIKELREHTGMGLREAKEAVEEMERHR